MRTCSYWKYQVASNQEWDKCIVYIKKTCFHSSKAIMEDQQRNGLNIIRAPRRPTTYLFHLIRRWVLYENEIWYLYHGGHAPSRVRNVLVMDTVRVIRHGAFSDCYELAFVYIPESVREIHHHAFYRCAYLLTVRLPASITIINNAAFLGCSRLENIILPNCLARIPQLAFAGCSKLTWLLIPYSVIEIGPQAFRWCSAMKWVKIPDSVLLLGYKAFHKCSALESVELPIGIPSMGNDIFAGCKLLKKVTLFESYSNTDSRDDNMCIVLNTEFIFSKGSKTLRMPKINLPSMWPHLLKQLDKNEFISHIGISQIGRKTAIFSFLQQNMYCILEVTVNNSSQIANQLQL